MIVLSLMCEGAIGAILPTITMQYFQHKRGHEVYSYMFAAFGTNSILGSIIVALFGYDLGYSGMLFLCLIMTIIASILTFYFPDG